MFCYRLYRVPDVHRHLLNDECVFRSWQGLPSFPHCSTNEVACSLASLATPVVQLHVFLRFYLLETHTHTQRQRHRQREQQAPRREPDVGLDPGSPGSRPGLKAALTAEPPGLPRDPRVLGARSCYCCRGSSNQALWQGGGGCDSENKPLGSSLPFCPIIITACREG